MSEAPKITMPEPVLTEDDVHTLVGHAEFLRRVRGEKDMPAYFMGLAERIAQTIGYHEQAERAAAIRRAAEGAIKP